MKILNQKRLFVLAVSTAVLGVGSNSAKAWWAVGHETITTAALRDLSGLGTFSTFLSANASTLVANSGNEPAGAHYIDIDATMTTTGNAGVVSYGADYQNYLNGTFSFPLTTAEATARYGSTYMGVSPAGAGGLPWYISDTVATLTTKMAAAKTYSDWTSLLSTAGAACHLIEDLHNPMHLASNYDGQMTGQTGLHARYEGYQFENGSANRYNELLSSTPVVAPTNYGSGTGLISAIFNRIPTDYNKNSVILSADTSAKSAGAYGTVAYNDALWNFTKTISIDSFQDASSMVASALYTAYVAAGSPVVPSAPLEAQSYEVTAASNATIQPGGPRSGTNGVKYFNVEGSSYGSYASYGVARFNTSSIKASLDAQYGVGKWVIDDVELSLKQAPASFSTDGAMKVFYSSDDTTAFSILRYSDKGSPLGVNVNTDEPVLEYLFSNTGDTDAYNSTTSESLDFSVFSNDILTGGMVTLVFYEGASNTAATYSGQTGLSLNVTAHAVPEPASLSLLSLGALGLLRRSRKTV